MKGYPTSILREGRKLSLITESATLHRIGNLAESASGEVTKARKWTCDIWKLGEENLNGRIYPAELANRLISEKPVTVVNDGHFADFCNGLEYLNAKAVAKNLRVEDGILKCDLEFLTEEKDYEDRLAELTQKGVAIGVSSVGYGSYLPDGKTIDPETYEVVRIVDFVTMPAGLVYASYEDADEDNTDELDNEDDDDEDEGVPVADCSEKSEARSRMIKGIVSRYRR